MEQFKKTVILYPICILAIWLPCIFLGLIANTATDVPLIREKLDARQTLATQSQSLSPDARVELRAKSAGDDVLVRLLDHYAPVWLAGILGAGIMAAVMASDSQILALSTLFTEDVFAFYGGKRRFGEAVQVQTGRAFVIVLTIIAYIVAMRAPQSIFDLAVQYAFSGYSALAPLLVAALFWRGSTKWGALAVAVWSLLAVFSVAIFQALVPAPAPGQPAAIWSLYGIEVLGRTPGGTTVLGFLPVVPMVVISCLLMVVVSVLTRKPAASTLQKYFQPARQA